MRVIMYKLVVQLVILYAIKIWVVTDAMIMVLDGFHHIIDRKIVGITARKDDGREWEWSSVGVALETAGLWPIREYKKKIRIDCKWCKRYWGRQCTIQIACNNV